MGRKNDQASKAEAEKADKVAEEDPPAVKELKAIDDKYLELQREFEKERNTLRRQYAEQQATFLKQRKEVLCASDGKSTVGTLALPRFWLQALQNSDLGEDIQEWDEPVLEYLLDITTSYAKDEDTFAGFTLTFQFAENPFFSNETLWKEYVTEEESPYTGEIRVKQVKCSDIEWRPGKDVTVERAVKKVKGGGAKKAKQKGKETAEPRDSFFRCFFRNLEEGMDVPEDVDLEGMGLMDDDDEDDDDVIEFLMDDDHAKGLQMRDTIIPFAVRWYTGEAAPSDDEDDDDEDEEEEEEDVEDDEETDDDAVPLRKKPEARGRAGRKSPAKGSPSTKPATDPKTAADAKNEECKQQ